jgi:hypothetical protein
MKKDLVCQRNIDHGLRLEGRDISQTKRTDIASSAIFAEWSITILLSVKLTPILIQEQRDDFPDPFPSEDFRAGFDVHLRIEECKEPTHGDH